MTTQLNSPVFIKMKILLKADKNVRKLKTNKRKLKSQAVDFNGKLLFYFLCTILEISTPHREWNRT